MISRERRRRRSWIVHIAEFYVVHIDLGGHDLPEKRCLHVGSKVAKSRHKFADPFPSLLGRVGIAIAGFACQFVPRADQPTRMDVAAAVAECFVVSKL